MKKIIILITTFALVFFGCKKEPIAPLEIADFSVHVGGQNQNTAGRVSIDNFLTFLDISQNTTEHEWRIADGSFFLSDEVSNADADFADFKISGAGNVSIEKKVNVLFTEAGLHPVQIYNTFDQEPKAGPATAVEQGGLWVVDTTYMIDVYANLEPAFKVFKGMEEVLSVSASDIPDISDASSWPTIEVEAGESLTFVDLTTIGRPSSRAWSFEGAVPAASQDSAATVSYFALGTYLAGNINSERSGALPAQEIAKVIPIQVSVVPSTQPFFYEGNLVEQVDEKIVFNVGGELAPFSGQEGTFTVRVVNEAAGFDQEIAVSSAKISDNDATAIELTLAEPIYNSDVLTLSYAGSEIKSADARILADFGPETVAMHFEPNAIQNADWASFETEDPNWKKAFAFGFWVGNSNGDAMMPHYARTQERFVSGTSSMKLDLYNGIENKLLQGGDFSNSGLAAGDYLLKFKLYLEPGNILTTLQTIVQTPSTTTDFDITNTPRGEWVEMSQPASFAEAPTGRYDFKITAAVNPVSADSQILYIDDYEFVPLEIR